MKFDGAVVISGGFDPIHIGHLRMIQEAAKLGTKLIVMQVGFVKFIFALVNFFDASYRQIKIGENEINETHESKALGTFRNSFPANRRQRLNWALCNRPVAG